MKLKFFNKIILAVLFFAITPLFGGLCYADVLDNHVQDTKVAYNLGIESQENINSDDCSGKNIFLISDVGLKNRDQENKTNQACLVNNFVFISEIIKNSSLDIVPINPPSPPYEKEMLSAIFKRE